MIRLLVLFSMMWVSTLAVLCGEGMWLPLLLDSLNYKDMQEKGLMLTFDEIYSTDRASLKDAVVIFGGGCTGEVISPEGLLITNHHCGYSRIQAHSTVENDLLTNGFWAKAKPEELPNPGLSVTFLVRMENVSDRVLANIPDTLTETIRNEMVSSRIMEIRNEAIAESSYEAEIKPFFFGREYYLFVYERYHDIRLVGAPSESIGRFGGDTDNWVWPRHTGDFALFRIYAGKDNKPAAYSPDNVPYIPKKYLNVSLGGVKEGDFTMVMGFPGRTDQYLTSDGLSMITGKCLPAKIEMRTLRREALEEQMNKNAETRLNYISKYVSLSNSWKKWIGVLKGIEQSQAIENKEKLEKEFRNWASQLPRDTSGYAALLSQLNDIYALYEPVYLSNDIGSELLNSLELSPFLHVIQTKYSALVDSSDEFRELAIQQINTAGKGFFRSNALEMDRKLLPEFLKIYEANTVPTYHPAFYKKITTEFGGNHDAFVAAIFKNSIFTDSLKYKKIFRKSAGKIRDAMINDPVNHLYRDFSQVMIPNIGKFDSLSRQLNSLYRKYIAGLSEMNPSRILYPDANFTMRISYGRIEGYKPADGVEYDYYSTLDGIIEKENPDIPDYTVPEQLKVLNATNDLGPYASNGKLPVCFIASNHTSGGNSGSPVLNGKGELIGINFDRNWEGTVSDYAYNPAICRNISLDMRYVLFIIDKVADADWILNELNLIYP